MAALGLAAVAGVGLLLLPFNGYLRLKRKVKVEDEPEEVDKDKKKLDADDRDQWVDPIFAFQKGADSPSSSKRKIAATPRGTPAAEIRELTSSRLAGTPRSPGTDSPLSGTSASPRKQRNAEASSMAACRLDLDLPPEAPEASPRGRDAPETRRAALDRVVLQPSPRATPSRRPPLPSSRAAAAKGFGEARRLAWAANTEASPSPAELSQLATPLSYHFASARSPAYELRDTIVQRLSDDVLNPEKPASEVQELDDWLGRIPRRLSFEGVGQSPSSTREPMSPDSYRKWTPRPAIGRMKGISASSPASSRLAMTPHSTRAVGGGVKTAWALPDPTQ